MPPPPTDARLREELVAYLDGELAGDDEAAIEARIARDQHCRADMQRFERVWNALDVLPRATVDDAFTQTTIEMVAVEAAQEVNQQTLMMPARKRSRTMRWVAVAIAATIAGLVLSRVVVPNPNRSLYNNLPLIAEFDAYNQRLDVDFLRQLRATLPDEFGDSIDESVAVRAERLAALTSAGYNERAKFVAALPTDEQYELAAEASRFEATPPPRRAELERLHNEISSSDDSLQLWEAMLVYSNMTSRLAAADQASLRSLETPERLKSLEQFAKREYWRGAMELSTENARRLREGVPLLVVEPSLVQNYQRLKEILPAHAQLALNTIAERKAAKGFEKLVILFFAKRFERDKTPEYLVYFPELVSGLLGLIDDEAQQRLRRLPVHMQIDTLGRWAAEAMWKPTTENLEDFFKGDQITDDDRRRLLALPENEMNRELREMYTGANLGDGKAAELFRGFFGDRDRRFGFREGSDGDRRGPGGPGGPPPPPGSDSDGRPRRGGPPPN